MSARNFKPLILCSVVVAMAVLLSGCSSTPAVSLAQETPEKIVENFYGWYMDYPGNALADGAYRSSEYLTEEFVQQVDEIIASFDKGGYDPFLCAQDIPGDLAFDQAIVSEGEASVVVRELWNPGTPHETSTEVTIALRMADDEWKIADIICSVGQVAAAPEQVVESFYNWYLAYAQNTGNVLADGAYRSSEHLTEEFVQQVDEIIASFDKGGYDPFLCAQDIPQSFTIQEAEVTGDAAQVIVHTSFERHQFAVTLKRVGEIWKIDDILCGGNETESAQIGDWKSFADEQYGFRLRFPGEWDYEESPPTPPGEVPDGMKALKRVLFFQPQGWEGVAPPLHIQVTEGTEEEFERLYVPATATEHVRINDSDVIKAIEDVGGMQVIRYIFQSPTEESVRVVGIDYISGFPERAEGNDDVIQILQQVLHTVEFAR